MSIHWVELERLGYWIRLAQLRSEIVVVILPAGTGKDNINKIDVKKIDHGNKGKKGDEYSIERLHAFNNVIIKFIEPNKELNPAICKEKNIKSTE